MINSYFIRQFKFSRIRVSVFSQQISMKFDNSQYYIYLICQWIHFKENAIQDSCLNQLAVLCLEELA